jgi:hypothetical protein
MQASTRREYERTLLEIARALPPGRVEQLIDYARFLEAQMLNEALEAEEPAADIEADNAAWDALLATDGAQTVLEKLVGEAAAEYRAGKTKSVALDDEGRLAPE